MPQVLVVADDLSGGHDCAARLAVLGGRIPTARRAEHLRGLSAAKALVLDAETRFLPPARARWRMAQAWASLNATAAAPWRFQKLDSTLRGNPGEEVMGMAQACAAPWVAMLPAYPRAGRQTLNGRQLVHGVPLERTEYFKDPLSPAKVGRPQDLFPASLRLHAPLAWVQGGAGRLARELRRAFRRRQPRFVTFDCAKDQDVITIARASVAVGGRHFAGASALAGALAGLVSPAKPKPALPPRGLPWMILAGSVSDSSFEQLTLAQARGALHWAALEAQPTLAALRSARRSGPLALSTLGGREGLRAGAGERAIQRLIALALRLVPDPQRAAWSLTGGHSALRFFEAAGFDRFDVLGEVLPGLALGHASGPRGGAWAATKPGAFGGPELYPRFLELVQAR